MASVKRTFTLDDDTAGWIDRLAARLGIPKSRVVREAVGDYAARIGRLSEEERGRLLDLFDQVVPRIPSRPAADADREIAAVRRVRRKGGRGMPPAPGQPPDDP